MKTDYIIKTKEALYNLAQYENDFELEAKIIWRIKCLLMQREEIDGFYVDGVYVNVHKTSEGYQAYYRNITMNLTVYNKQIVAYSVE